MEWDIFDNVIVIIYKLLGILIWPYGPKLPLWVTDTYIKVVPDSCYRYLFRVKVKTVKLVGGRRFLAVRNGLNVRTHSKLISI